MSVISGSSMGHSEGSLVNKVELHSLKPGQEDEFDGGDGKGLLTGLFGVLYTISKERTPSWQLVAFRCLLDWLQLFLVLVKPQFGFNGFIKAGNTGWQVFSALHLEGLVADRGYSFFSAVLYIIAVALIVNVALGVWIGHSFLQNRFDATWPVTTMRWFGLFVFQLFALGIASLLMAPLDCHLYGTPAALNGYNQAFPDVYCWEMPHLIQVFVSVLCLLVFTVSAMCYTMGEMELNLATKSYTAVAHSKVEVYGLLIKITMVVIAALLSNHQHMAIVQIILAVLLVWLYANWVPHYYNVMNYVRVGTYVSIVWTALTLVLVVYPPSGTAADVSHYRTQVTSAMWGGIVPFFLIGAAIAYFRLRFFHVTIVNRFLAATPTTKPKNIYKFTDSRQVEIVGRVCRKWMAEDDEVLDPHAVDLAELVMKAGTALLPSDPFMIVLYSSFLMDVQVSCQSGYTLLQNAKKSNPSLFMKFAIFSREQQHSQNKASGGGSGADLISFVEFERNYRLAKKVHREALLAMRAFWALLPHSIVQFETLANAVEAMDASIRVAEKVYRSVLQRHATNVKLVRLYAKFLELVKHDPWSASKWFAEADKLEQQAEDVRNSNVFGDLVVDDPHVRASLLALGNAAPGQDVPAVIIMDAHAIILMTNPTAADLFGYDKARNELVGRNVNVLIPPPFCENHTTYVRTYIMTGKQTILNQRNEFVALHKERHVLPIQLTVSKISGFGEDTLLMGIIQPITPEPDVATLWVLENGQMLSVDEAYTDWFAFKPEDVVGGSLSTFVPSSRDADRILRALAKNSVASAQALNKAVTNSFRKEQHAALPRTTESGTAPSAIDKASLLYADTAAAAGSLHLSGESHGTPLAASKLAAAIFGRQETSSKDGGLPLLPGAQRSETGLRELPPLPGGGKDQQRVAGVLFQHKYADTNEVDVSIMSGGIGAYKFFQLSLRRSPRQPPQPHMFVSDKKGRIMHITHGLSAFLGSSPKALMANDMQHAVEALLPQPFAQLHRKLQTSLPVTAPPPYSCRSGLSILLASSARGTGGSATAATLPFRMRLQKRELTLSDEPYHLVTLEQRSVEQALAERRLVLLLDESGIVQSASDSPASLFGFKPSGVVGNCITNLVEELSGVGQSKQDVQALMLLLASRAAEVPGVAWRVTVQPPSSKAGQGGLGAVHALRTSPAMMSVALKPAANSVVVTGVPLPSEDTWDSPRATSALADEPDALLEVCLWRSDLVTSVLEIDSGGQIINSKDLPLYPPGLVFGTSSDEMRGSHIARYLPMLGSQSLHVLFDANGLGGQAPLDINAWAMEDPTKKRSNLKGMNAASSRNDKAGPLHYVRVRHQGDGAEVQLTVQAVRKESVRAAGALYLVVHPYQPSGGRSDLCSFLEAGGMMGNKSGTLSVAQVHGFASGGGAAAAGPLGPWAPRNEMARGPSASRRASIQLSLKQPTAESAPGDGQAERVLTAQNSLLYGVAPARHSVDSPILGRPISGRITPLSLSATNVSLARDGSLDQLAMPTMHAIPRNEGAMQGALHPDADPTSLTLEQLEQTLSKKPTMESPRMLPNLVVPAEITQIEPLNKVINGSGRSDRPSIDDSAAENVQNNRKTVQFGSAGSNEPHDLIKAWVASSASATVAVPPQRTSINLPQHSRFAAPSPAPARPADVNLVEVGEEVDEIGSDNGRDGRHGSEGSNSNNGDDGEDEQRLRRGNSDSDIDEAVTSGLDATDFRRGTRFKKLSRMLASKQVQNDSTRFRRHTFFLIALLAVVHVAMFTMFFLQVDLQKQGVVDLHNAGKAICAAGEVFFTTRVLDLFYSNMTVDGLVGLQTPDDLKAQMAHYRTSIELFKTYHNLYYLGPTGHRRLAGEFGLGHIWDTPSIPTTMYLDITTDLLPNGSVSLVGGVEGTSVTTPTATNMSLWDLGNFFRSEATSILYNAEEHARETGLLRDWSSFKFIIKNGPDVMTNAYLKTLDAQVQLVLHGTEFLNLIQVIVMVLEGIVLMLAVAGYTWYISKLLANQRFSIYNVFMVLPQGLVRGLATKRLDLDGEDGEDDDDDGGLAKQADSVANPNVLTTNNIKKAGEGADDANRATSFIKLSIVKSNSTAKEGDAATGAAAADGAAGKIWGGMSRVASMFRSKSMARFAPGGKRRLQPSLRASLLMTGPFVVWGFAVVVFNAVANLQVQAISAPIALFNMLNFVMIRHKRNAHNAQELCTNVDLSINEQYRDVLKETLPLLAKDYKVLLFGSAALPNETDVHYNLATQGLTFAPGNGVHLLYYTTACLCLDQSQCKGEDTIYYADTHGGIDRMMRRFMQMISTMTREVGAQPFLEGAEYRYAWSTKPDLIGGLETLELTYQANVVSTFDQVTTLHTIELVFTLLILLGFFVFLLRPFLRRLKNETRRIAELLAQLPAEIDVEGLLQRALAKPDPAVAGAADPLLDAPLPLVKSEGSQRGFN